MTVENCRDYCENYAYFGVENGHECFCGNSYRLPLDIVHEWECPMQCPGDISERCGGELRMNIWSRENTYGDFNALDLSLGEPFQQGVCYVYTPSNPPLKPDASIQSDTEMSLTFCQNFCVDISSFNKYFAVQGGNNCMCGSEINGILERAVPQTSCSTPCTGAGLENCGAENYFNLYEIETEN